MRRLVLGFLAMAWLTGCRGGSGGGARDPGDTSQADYEIGDPGADAVLVDVGADDASSDAEAPAACEAPTQGRLTPPVSDPKKFALAVFHFNIQYVAGGLRGLMPPERDPEGMFDYDNDATEDLIVTESFEPLLDLLLAHPTFAADIEMQGYMLDVMMDRHPGVVAKMRALVKRGQIAVQSFHYSDQLFTAHSRFSMDHSLEMNRRAFERACLPLSPAVFTQEGQFSEGMLEVMKSAGQTIGIMNGGPFDYQYASVPDRLLYRLRGQDVVTTRGMSEGPFTVTWWFVGDGETALTDDMSPYLGSAFRFSEAAAKKLVARLEQLKADGFFLTTVEDYVRYLKEAGVQAEPLPYSLDLTWRPDDADNVFAWMGRAGLWGSDEADNEVLSSLERSRIALMAADVALTWAAGQGFELDLPALRGAWQDAMRLQVLGEVSDSTGWNPWAGEVRYSLERAAAALDVARDILLAMQAASGKPHLAIHTGSGEVETLDEPPPEPAWQPVEAPFEVQVEAPGFEVEATWREQVPVGVPRVLELTLTLKKQDPGATSATLSFPRSGDRLVYSPAMLDEVADLALADLPGFQGQVVVPAANGLVGLGSGVFLLEDLRTVHLAAFFPKGEPRVLFRDQTLNGPGPYVFRFLVLVGATGDEALQAARDLNTSPTVRVP